VNDIDALEITSRLLDSFETVRKTIDKIESDHEFCDKELNDLTHALEFISFNASEGYKLAKQMKESRIKRRNAKNLKEELQPLYDLMKRYNNFFKELKNVHAEIEAIRGLQQKRIYSPRVRTDMQDAFEKVNGKQVVK
jgi:DNA repair ATPase RecN